MSRYSRSPGWRTTFGPRTGRAKGRGLAPLAPQLAPIDAAAPEAASVTTAGFSFKGSRFAPTVAVVLLALIAARVAEIVPGVARFRPALLAAVIGGSLVLFQTQPAQLFARFRNPVLIAFLGFAAWATVTVPFAVWPGQAANSLYPVFAPALVMITVLALCPASLSMLDRVTTGLVLSFGALFLSVLSDSLVWRGRLYTSGSLDPNDLASCAAIVFPMAIMQIRRRNPLWLLVALSVAPLAVYVLLQTGSRGGTLAFAASALTLCLVLPWRFRALASFLLIVGVPVVWAVAPPTFRNRVKSLTSLESDYNSYDFFGRKELWKRGIGYAVRNPITGVGLGNFDTAEGETLRALGQGGKWSAAHSAYIQVFAELGFVGGFFWTLLLARAAQIFARLARRRGRPEYIAALAGWAMGAVFLSHAYFWAFFGLIALAALAWQVELQGTATAALQPVSSAPARLRGWRTRHA
ncbi:MAG TPA: O-antigen ligase family protein [Gemmatimonadaceae bacterium]|nr:O-antigen ligase family protein [Gemmatimonadaceae bacterium]